MTDKYVDFRDKLHASDVENTINSMIVIVLIKRLRRILLHTNSYQKILHVVYTP